MRRNIRLFQNVTVKLDRFSVQCGSYTCFFSSICQIWLGDEKETRKLTGKFDTESLNLELNSGCIYSFLSNNSDFLLRAYHLFLSQKHGFEEETELDFEHGTIGDERKNLEEADPERVISKRAANAAIDTDKGVIYELKILLDFYNNKPGPDSQVISLLKEILAGIEQNKSDRIKELSRTFIQLSLIHDCNELGLGKLIAYVIYNVYQP